MSIIDIINHKKAIRFRRSEIQLYLVSLNGDTCFVKIYPNKF